MSCDETSGDEERRDEERRDEANPNDNLFSDPPIAIGAIHNLV
jgi:hypothetical protein